jgi:hypothetical protein
MMQYFETLKDGGFFFVENPLIVLTKNGGSNWNHLFANGHGGLVEGVTTVDSSFSVPCRLGNITNTLDALHPPPFAAGALSV